MLGFVPQSNLRGLIKEIESLFVKEGISYEIMQELANDDTWDNLDIESISVDTSIEDFAENHFGKALAGKSSTARQNNPTFAATSWHR
jgi:hypothetical protein